MTNRRTVLSSGAALALSAALPTAAWSQSGAQAWPSQTVRIIVPYTTGGGIDVLARLLAQKLTESWDESVVVENRPGAGAALGTAMVAKAAPDGHTFGIVSNTFAISLTGALKVPYELSDFAPALLATRAPFVLAVPASLDVRNVKDLIALASKRPDGLNFASAGTGTSTHMALELLKRRTRMPALHVPYKGSNPALLDLVDGRVDALFATPAAIMPLVKDGKLRALAVTGSKRADSAPGVPTMTESGVKDYVVNVWFGFLAPAGTPPEVLRRFHADAVKALRTPEMRDKLKSQGQELAGLGPDEFAAELRQEIATWSEVVREGNLRFN